MSIYETVKEPERAPGVRSRKAGLPKTPRTESGLTERQVEILSFIVRFDAERGYAPGLRDIMAEFRISSTNGARDHLVALERAGFISRDPKVARSIRVLKGAK